MFASFEKNEKNEKQELQYIRLISDILNFGSMENTRNGNCLTLIGSTMRFSLKNNTIPLLTTKKIAWKTCLKELLWFIGGHTDNKLLQAQNVKIWNGNASREFLDQNNLKHLKENDLGPVYGHQWRHFNAEYTDCSTDYSGKGIDQLAQVIAMLSDPAQRSSRRIVMSAWNPCQIKEMALPPCHVLVQFHVTNGNELSASMYQRSGDVGLGVPFNIASYSFLIHILAVHCNLVAKEFIYHLGNCHIYDDHIEPLRYQISNRTPYDSPTVEIEKQLNIEDYNINHFSLKNYQYHDTIKMEMRK
jgi:thymidylate synthase